MKYKGSHINLLLPRMYVFPPCILTLYFFSVIVPFVRSFISLLFFFQSSHFPSLTFSSSPAICLRVILFSCCLQSSKQCRETHTHTVNTSIFGMVLHTCIHKCSECTKNMDESIWWLGEGGRH